MKTPRAWIRLAAVAAALLGVSTAAPAGVNRWTSLGPRGMGFRRSRAGWLRAESPSPPLTRAAGASPSAWPWRSETRDGYFSLPDFMGDPTFPEVFVQIRERYDGSLVFHHTGLTDLAYELTVTDETTRSVATYANDTSDNLRPCGGLAILSQ